MKITEALAEVKTLQKRIASKRQFVLDYLTRDSRLKDPLEKDGGSFKVLAAEQQAIGDLEERLIAVRAAILQANLNTKLTVQGETRSVFNWLTWRKELSPTKITFLQGATQALLRARATNAQQQAAAGGAALSEIISNVDEKAHGQQVEHLQQVLGELDGQLSMLNATVEVVL